MSDPRPERLADMVGGAARWIARAAFAGAVAAGAAGLALWLAIALLDLTSGGVVVLAWFVACLVPAACFLVLWRRMHRIRRDSAYYVGDVRAVYRDVRGAPVRLHGAVTRLLSARGLWSRVGALREVAGVMMGSGESEQSRARFSRLYATLTGLAPITAVVGAVGGAVLAIAVPAALLWALAT